MANERSKASAAARAVAFVETGNVVGLGTGSTSEIMLKLLAERIENEGLQIQGVPTSKAILEQARQLGIPILPGYPDFGAIDLDLDGADEADPGGGLIKGGGGALLREKLVAAASARFYVMIDASKHVEILGTTRAVPVEVIPFGWGRLKDQLQFLGARVELRSGSNGQTFLTDQGNYIFDCNFGPIPGPATLERQLIQLPGVVETGLFLGMTTALVSGTETGSATVIPIG